MQLLITPAINQDQAATFTACLGDTAPELTTAKTINAQRQENKKGPTAGDGPGAKALSQGNTMSIAIAKILKLD